MTIAQELENRAWVLSDPAIQWVQHIPLENDESCLAVDGVGHHEGTKDEANNWLTLRWVWTGNTLSAEAADWLFKSGWLDADYAVSDWVSLGNWNDKPGRTREQVIWLALDASEDAAELGV